MRRPCPADPMRRGPAQGNGVSLCAAIGYPLPMNYPAKGAHGCRGQYFSVLSSASFHTETVLRGADKAEIPQPSVWKTEGCESG